MNENSILEYFQAEKMESLLFMILGGIGILAAIFVFIYSIQYKNIIYPFIVIGLIQIIVGGSVIFRTDKQVESLLIQLNQNKIEFKKSETSRMQIVIKNFEYYKALEIFLIFLGIVLSYLYPARVGIYSIAIGLILESSLMLVLDLFAEKRAIDYIQWIQNLN